MSCENYGAFEILVRGVPKMKFYRNVVTPFIQVLSVVSGHFLSTVTETSSHKRDLKHLLSAPVQKSLLL